MRGCALRKVVRILAHKKLENRGVEPRDSGQGVAMSTSAVMPFRSFVQMPIFSVSPSSFSLSPTN